MAVLETKIDRNADAFKENAAGMRALVDDLRATVAEIETGGGEQARERHLGRGKLLPRERVNRLLIPFIVGSILLTPFQKYLEALHKETFQGTFLSYIPEMLT